ncbi:MAG TPA: Xaa-Pro peptidase family protein, partial [Acidimicrobiales bacterium]|nr:Xaa-Pro peptidase family protein [Acidimicrobiales bacterium]
RGSAPPMGIGDLDAPLAPLSVVGRLDRLRKQFDEAGPEGRAVDALLVTTPANVRWLTGFSGSAGRLLVTTGRAWLTTDGRYRTQAAEQLDAAGVADVIEVVVGNARTQREAVVTGAVSVGAHRIGLEADRVTWADARDWERAFERGQLEPTRGVVEALRAVKDAGEVARMERAAAIADAALSDLLPRLSELAGGGGDLTESVFAADLDHAMRRRGAEESAFETIVASGENSAKPHARPGPRPIRRGDPVVIDFGATYDGYRSDMTRTVFVGEPSDGELADVWAVVFESQRAGVDAVAPGVSAAAVDETCRGRIAEAGWADRFEHGTGHGVGLDIHEAPAVGPGSTAILQVGTVVTVEPGVYLPGRGGVRIEDTLVVTEHGSRPFTRFPKEVAV